MSMKPEKAIKYFGTQEKTAAAVGISQPSVAKWISSGVIPALRQIQLQMITNGRLKADKNLLRVS